MTSHRNLNQDGQTALILTPVKAFLLGLLLGPAVLMYLQLFPAQMVPTSLWVAKKACSFRGEILMQK